MSRSTPTIILDLGPLKSSVFAAPALTPTPPLPRSRKNSQEHGFLRGFLVIYCITYHHDVIVRRSDAAGRISKSLTCHRETHTKPQLAHREECGRSAPTLSRRERGQERSEIEEDFSTALSTLNGRATRMK